MKFTKW